MDRPSVRVHLIQRGCMATPKYLIRANYTAEGTKGLIA